MLLASCATNGFVGKGYGPATRNPRVNVNRAYIPLKEPDKPIVTKSKPLKRNGRYSSVGFNPPK